MPRHHRIDEIGNMIRAMQTMQKNIRDFIIVTSESAQQVAAAAEELTATSEQSTTTAEEVAKAIEEIAKGASDQAKDTEKTAINIENMAVVMRVEVFLQHRHKRRIDNKFAIWL